MIPNLMHTRITFLDFRGSVVICDHILGNYFRKELSLFTLMQIQGIQTKGTINQHERSVGCVLTVLIFAIAIVIGGN